MHSVSPKVFISYERFAWFGKEDKDFRLTFDKNIFTRRYDMDLNHGAHGDPLISNKEYLLEIKTSGAYPFGWQSYFLQKKYSPNPSQNMAESFKISLASRVSREVKQYA
jgi:hypothetical protein